MSTTNPAHSALRLPPSPSFVPTRVLRALHTRRAAIDGPTACNDLLLECITAERVALTTAVEQSGAIEGQLQRHARLFQEAVADGIVTAQEKLRLLRAQVTLRRQTRTHTHHLAGLL